MDCLEKIILMIMKVWHLLFINLDLDTTEKDLGRKFGVICNLPGVLKV
jgi:hypothetical protein